MKTPRRSKQLALTNEAKDEERFQNALHLFKNARGQCSSRLKIHSTPVRSVRFRTHFVRIRTLSNGLKNK
jgi:hypothetical protein